MTANRASGSSPPCHDRATSKKSRGRPGSTAKTVIGERSCAFPKLGTVSGTRIERFVQRPAWTGCARSCLTTTSVVDAAGGTQRGPNTDPGLPGETGVSGACGIVYGIDGLKCG